MSKDHTRLKDGELDRRVSDAVCLQNTVEVLERINKQSSSFNKKMQEDFVSLSDNLTGTRQQFLSQLEKLEQDTLEIINRHGGNFDKAKNDLDRIANQIEVVGQQINQIMSQKRQILSNAVDWYNEAKREFILVRDNPVYKKFAPRTLEDLRVRIMRLDGIQDWSTSGLEATCQILLSDIYNLDLSVSNSRRQYEALEIEAGKLAFGILENARELRDKLMLGKYNIGQNIDFWTGNRFRDIENEVNEIVATIERRRNDPLFGIHDLECLIKRLNELNEAKDLLAKSAMENVILSELCKGEVVAAGKLFVNRHKFKCIGSGYEENDRRKCFKARFKRSDGAEVELIGAYGEEKGTIQLIRRFNTSSYMSEEFKEEIIEGINNTLKEGGIMVEESSSCASEELEPFDLRIPSEVREAHGISPVVLGANY